MAKYKIGQSFVHHTTTVGEGTRIGHFTSIEDYCQIGKNSFIGNCVTMRPYTRVGDNVIIGHGSVFEGDAEIGDDTLIHAQCHITNGVKIGKGVFIAPFFCGANDLQMSHMRRDIIPFVKTPYVIEDYVRIAIGVLVNPGVTIGMDSLVRMGSVVTRDVPRNAIVQGIPARVIGEVPEEERLGKLKLIKST